MEQALVSWEMKKADPDVISVGLIGDVPSSFRREGEQGSVLPVSWGECLYGKVR